MAALNTALQQFDSLPDTAIVRLPTVRGLYGVSGPTVWRWCKAGRLPPPIKLGGVTGWRVGDLRRNLAQVG